MATHSRDGNPREGKAEGKEDECIAAPEWVRGQQGLAFLSEPGRRDGMFGFREEKWK